MAKKIKSFSKSALEYKKACQVLSGGVNSPVRSFSSVGGTPLFIQKALGSKLFDVDGNVYIDYCQSWGASILGHAHPRVVQAVQKQAARGLTYGITSPLETELATELIKLFPSCEQFRMVSSGTEAVMTAIRLARGISGKSRIIKFEGCYHGHSDYLLVKAGSGLATLGKPSSEGVPSGITRDTLVLPYNDIEALDRAFERFDDIAAVILEPLAGNMGVIPANYEFLKRLRAITKRRGSFLIFDEVITGLRMGLHGAQGLYAIEPDMTTLGKVIGGGMPIGALGAKKKLMKFLAPQGGVYQAGTLSGNPMSMVAGLTTLKLLKAKHFYSRLEKRTATFAQELEKAFQKNGIACTVPTVGSIFGLFFQTSAPQNFKNISRDHVTIYKAFFHHMLASGVYLPPSAYEAMFLSSAHTSRDLAETLKAVRSFEI